MEAMPSSSMDGERKDALSATLDVPSANPSIASSPHAQAIPVPYNIVSINEHARADRDSPDTGRRRSSAFSIFNRIKTTFATSKVSTQSQFASTDIKNTRSFGRKVVFGPLKLSEGSYNYESYNSRRSNAVFVGPIRSFLMPILNAHDAFMFKLKECVIGSRKGQFIDNTVRTARYTIFDFVPKQIIIQFSKFANIYFLLISLLQIVPGWSPTGQFTTIFPLTVFVTLAMIKEAWEDYQRHKHDQAENGLISRKLSIEYSGAYMSSHEEFVSPDRYEHTDHGDLTTKWQEILWKDVKVGDIILIQEGDVVPADVVVLFSSHQNGSCYIETSNLDGESNLKQKLALPASQTIIHGQNSFTSLSYEIEAESPSGNLNHFEGYIELKGELNGKHTLTINHLLPRGTSLVNTNFIFGVVIYTGEDTKIRKNATTTQKNKIPTLEKTTNRIVIYMFIFVLALTTISTILSAIWEIKSRTKHWYLMFSTDTTATFFSYMILYNNMIPISLYVAMEFVKLMEVFYINSDLSMYDSLSDTAAQARTSNLHEDLGQVQYLFTDKTGTLTQNIMLFKKMSVSGVSYKHGLQPDDYFKSEAAAISTQKLLKSSKNMTDVELPSESLIKDLISCSTKQTAYEFEVGSKTAFEFLLAIALCHTVEPNRKHAVVRKDKSGYAFGIGKRNVSAINGSTISAEDMAIEYQSSSPDEVALVNAARDMSFILRGRTMTTLTLNTLFSPKDVTFDILHSIEFSSKRKRMSSIYRYPDGRIVLICKGADSVILERLRVREEMSTTEKEALDKTLEHLAVFATEGLRTLLYATRELDADEYKSWSADWELASLSIKNRTNLMESIAERIECGLTLLGATAIEDKLQVGVPDTIDKLRRAGIKVWMLTGDKRETAINIGYTCNIAKENSDILIIDGTDADAIDASLKEAMEKVQLDCNNRKSLKSGMAPLNLPRLSIIPSPEETNGAERQESPDHQLVAKITPGENDSIVHNVVVIDGDCLLKLEQEEREMSELKAGRKGSRSRLNRDSLLDRFLDLATICDGVICCRFSPSQKALIVSKVRDRTSCWGGAPGTYRGKGQSVKSDSQKSSLSSSWMAISKMLYEYPSGVTLAIGDGANDIPMLQSAHVGIGITGREGLAASRASDYAIAQFRYLQPLLFVHGRWSYLRISLFTLGTFYKCFTFYLTQALFQIVTGWSATSFYEQWTLTLYNILFSSLPVIVIGIFEKDLNKSTLLGVPELYSYGQYNRGLNTAKFMIWMAQAVWHSIVSVFLPLLLYGGLCITADTQCLKGSISDCFCSDMNAGQDSSLYSIGSMSYTIVILLVNLKVSYVESHNWTTATHICFAASQIVWWIFNIIYSRLYDIRIPGVSQVGTDTASQFETTQQGTSNQVRYWSVQFLAVVLSFAFFDATRKMSQWKYDRVTTSLLMRKKSGKVFAEAEEKPKISVIKSTSVQRQPTDEKDIPISNRRNKMSKRKSLPSNVVAFAESSSAAGIFAGGVLLSGTGQPLSKDSNISSAFDWGGSVALWQLWEQKNNVKSDQDGGKDILHIINVNN
ncbi:hypothetical protein HDU67_000591 [Dinochytrium kinnereticum]|nr:hypothetical protein HDU67_000591 [Dinochytrium kinnereticum]